MLPAHTFGSAGDHIVALAQSGGEPSMFGWYLGFAIALAVVVIVVLVVASLLQSASRIRKQAGMATEALAAGYENTLPLWDVATTNTTARAILDDAVAAREALEG